MLRVLLTFCFAFGALSSVVLADAANPTIVNSARPNPVIGSPPPVDVAEYAPHTKKGPNVLAFRWQLLYSNGTYTPCRDGDDGATLFPSTAYTRWLIQRFALDIVGSDEDYYKLLPGDRGFKVVAPSFLQRGTRDSILRDGSCVNGWVVFSNLPSGTTWIAVGDVGQFSDGGPTYHTEPGVEYNPALGLLEGTTKQVQGANYHRKTGGNLMISEQYHIGTDSDKPITNAKVYSFGTFFE
jgi:hypothetical protein